MSGEKSAYGQLCDTCDNACGGCCWTELDETGKARLEPVPGWTAEMVNWKPFRSRASEVLQTYKITACPLYIQTKRKAPPKPHPWRYTQPVMSIDNFTGEIIVYENIECVVRAGFDVDMANTCLLSKYNSSHKGSRFFPALPEYISPCFVCAPKKRKKCNAAGGVCAENMAFQRARLKDKVRVITVK